MGTALQGLVPDPDRTHGVQTEQEHGRSGRTGRVRVTVSRCVQKEPAPRGRHPSKTTSEIRAQSHHFRLLATKDDIKVRSVKGIPGSSSLVIDPCGDALGSANVWLLGGKNPSINSKEQKTRC